MTVENEGVAAKKWTKCHNRVCSEKKRGIAGA